MGISIAEFRVAMETYGAERLPDSEGSRYSVPVPFFAVGNFKFLHSGSYYVVHRGKEIPNETMNQAMAEFGETHPGANNFWWGEVYSVRGLLTLAAMLEGKYSKSRIDELTNATYKKLIDSMRVHSSVNSPVSNTQSPKMEELCKLLVEYNSIVNPFSEKVSCKEPASYLDKVKLSIAVDENNDTSYTDLILSNDDVLTKYNNDENGWLYSTEFRTQKNGKPTYVYMSHYYLTKNADSPADEIVYLDYNDIDLRISLKTGKAWQTYKEKQAAPATDEQINMMILFLKRTIKKIRNKIVYQIIEI